MRTHILAVVLATGACAGPPVHVEDFGGAYATHFGGIPDRGRVCAVVANRSERRLAWIRVRVRAFEDAASRGRPAWTADWLYEDGLAPGESVALELRDLAVAPGLELAIGGSSRSGPAPPGRAAERVERCSEPALVDALRRELADRTADVAVHPMRRRPPATVLTADVE